MTADPLHLVVPGALDQRTGGYRYDARMAAGLRAVGRTVVIHELAGRFPRPDEAARDALDEALAGLPDGAVVVVDGLAMGGLPEVMERQAPRLRLVALVHHPLADETGLDPALRDDVEAREARGLGAACGVVVTSAFTARRVEGMGVPAGRIRVVEPGTSRPVGPPPQRRERAPGASAATRATPNMAAVRILCVGTLTPRKGQLLLVEALAAMGPGDWRCRLVGSATRDPDYARRVRDAIARDGLDGSVEVAGEVDEDGLQEAWSQADLFVLPSYYEGYGMALTEALVRGLPIVSTTGGAIPHTLPGTTALLVPPGDVDALRQTLERVLVDAHLRAALRTAALRHAARLPGWAEQSARFARAVDALSAP